MGRILVVEDDEAIASAIAAELEACGHDTSIAGDGAVALDRVRHETFDAITLDRMLPGLDGLVVVEMLRNESIKTPVLMISALGDVDERIAGLRAGGDDYLVKPFAPSEMSTRIEVLIRRAADTAPVTTLAVGGLRLDLLTRSVTLDGQAVRLFPTEFKLIELLTRNAGQSLSRQFIFREVWGYRFDPGTNGINVHIARLRQKLDRPGASVTITTVKGEGYRLDRV